MELDALIDALSVDRAETGARFSNNFALYERFLRKFPQEPTFAAIRQAREAGDADAYLAAVHTLKGVAGNLGLTRLFSVCTELLAALRGGQTLPQTQELDDRLAEEYWFVKDTIEQA